jgi:hypothetical protein
VARLWIRFQIRTNDVPGSGFSWLWFTEDILEIGSTAKSAAKSPAKPTAKPTTA